MKVLAPEMQVFLEYLQSRKLKVTPHRQLILETFLENEGHRSVEDIYRVVRTRDPRVGYTTVYRTMKILADCGLARGWLLEPSPLCLTLGSLGLRGCPWRGFGA